MLGRLIIASGLGASVLMVPGAQAPPPSVSLSNGLVNASIYLPDAVSGFYRGTRFDWAGVVGRLEFKGHTYYGPWFTRTDPAVRDFVYDGSDITAGPNSAITGPVEEFSTEGQGLGYAEAPPGGTFIKIGVGVLRKPSDGSAYSAFRLYEIVDGGTRTFHQTANSIEFTQDVQDAATGYGYTYTKTLTLPTGEPRLVIEHRLVNRGRRPIVSNVYDHNFLVLDGQGPGPDVVIGAPFPWQTPRPTDPAFVTIDGQRFRYVKMLTGQDRVSTPFQGFGPAATEYAFTIDNTASGAGMKIVGDRPLSSLSLWSIRSVLALEPFIAIAIDPGADFTWRYTYEYYVSTK